MASSIYDRIKERRLEMGLDADTVAQRLGISRATYYRYESKKIKKLPITILKPLADILDTTPEYLMGWDEIPLNPESDEAEVLILPNGVTDVTNKKLFVTIPIYSYKRLNIPFNDPRNIAGHTEITQEMAASGKYFAFLVNDDAMAPCILQNDIVIIKQQNVVDNKQIAFVSVGSEKVTIKEVKISQAGITLIGWNIASYQPHFYSHEEVKTLPIKIIGRVIEVRRKL